MSSEKYDSREHAEQARLQAMYDRQRPPLARPQGFACWGCGSTIKGQGDGVSLSGGSELNCCHKCRDKIDLLDWLKLRQRAQSDRENAEGLRQLAWAIRAILSAAAENGKQPPLDDVGFDAAAGYGDE